MNERKKAKEKKAEKDYYFPVILSQLLCFGVVLIIFFTMNSEDKAAVRERYSSLLEEDFLSTEFASVVSAAGEYINRGGKAFAVVGSRVEHYDEAEEGHSEANNKESTVFEPQKEASVTSSETVSDEAQEPAAVQTAAAVAPLSSSVRKTAAVPLKLTGKKTDNIIFPLYDGRYTSLFGARTDPITEGSDYHKGIDIGADEGDRIRAVYEGEIISVGEDERSGKYVFLEHKEGIVTFYCHCSDILADVGDRVEKGDTIALVGSTGYATGPHLHFEVRINGESVDPLPLLKNAD